MTYSPPPIFETERLILRPFIEQDYQLMRSLDVDPLVVKYLGHGQVRTENETLSNLQKLLRDYQKYGLGLYAVEDKNTGEFLGRSGLIPWIIEDSLMWEIGYSFKQSAWGKGYATECAKFLSEWGFKNLQAQFLISLIHPNNQNSIHVAEKIGMTYWKDILIGSKLVSAFRLMKPA
jgi:RimJ/RimL family protein N-acetyltransferase